MDTTIKNLSEHHKIELPFIYETLSKIQDRRGQIFVFFGTASLTVLGVALQQQKAGIILVSIAFILLYIGAEGTARAEMAPFLYRGYMIEREYKEEGEILSTYIDIVEPRSNLRDEFERILYLEDPSERIKEVNKIFYNPFKVKKATTMMAIVTIALEIIFMLLLHYRWNWPYF
jgi:hypothetical protein